MLLTKLLLHIFICATMGMSLRDSDSMNSVGDIENLIQSLSADDRSLLMTRLSTLREEDKVEGGRRAQLNVAHQCNTLYMHSAAPSITAEEMDNGISFDEIIHFDGPLKGDRASIFLQEYEAVRLKDEESTTPASSDSPTTPSVESTPTSGSSTVTGASKGSDALRDDSLHCECEEYACHCRKQCFCRLFDGQYDGDKVSKSSKSASDSLKSPDHQFKCACSFDGVGGIGMISGGTMDCDCKVADCSCEKKCVCSPSS